jgi:D-sedoheptulose 7-phosphate isomerase
MKKVIKEYLNAVSNNFKNLDSQIENISLAANLIIDSLKNENKIIFCGNGGSAADSQHLAAELVGRYKLNRDPLSAISLTVDTSAITAIANDFGYDEVFSKQLLGIGKKNDVLYAISTSGKSKSIINAIKVANSLGIRVISLTGKNISTMNELSDITINTPSFDTNHIQEMHIAIGQLICGIVENHFYGENE